jgi:hypothetical protein
MTNKTKKIYISLLSGGGDGSSSLSTPHILVPSCFDAEKLEGVLHNERRRRQRMGKFEDH